MGVGTRANHADKVDQPGGIVIRGDLLHVLVREAVRVELITGDTQAHAEVGTNLGAYRFDHFQAELHPAFKGAAPFVSALVDPWRPELVDHMLVHGRQLDAVQAAGFGPSRCLGEVTDDAPHFLRLDGLAGGTVYRFADTGRRHQGRPVEAIPA